MKRVLRRILVGALALVLLLAALLTAALYSETAFRWTINAAGPLIPGELHYAELDGSLAGPVQATGVRYDVAGTRIAVDRLFFDLSPLALLRNDIRIDSLEASGVVVTLPPATADADDAATAPPGTWLERLALPALLDIPGARVHGVTINDNLGATRLALDELALSLQWGERRIAIRRLDAHGPTLDVSGDVVLGLRGNAETLANIAASWRGAPFAIAGTIEASGTPAKLALDVDLDAPATAALDATLFDLAGTPRWHGALHVSELRPAALRDTLPDIAWSADLQFDGDWQDTALNGAVRGGWPPAADIALVVDGAINAERLRLEQVHGGVGAFGVRLDAEAELQFANGLRYAAAGTFDRFDWPTLAGFSLRDGTFDISGDTQSLHGRVSAAAGDPAGSMLHAEGDLAFESLRFDATASGHALAFVINGTPLRIAQFEAAGAGVPADYRLRAKARVAVDERPPASIVATAHGDATSLLADVETLQWLNGTASGVVELAWQDAFQLDADIRARGFELDRLDRQLAGTLGGRFGVTARFGETSADINANIASLDGRIDELEITGSGNLRLAGGRLSTRGLELRAGDARLVLEDSVARGFDFRFDAADLSRFHAALGGTVNLSGHMEGTVSSPSVAVNARGEGVSWRDWSAAAFTLDANMKDGGTAESTLELDATDLDTPFIDAGTLSLDATGRIEDHALSLAVDDAGNDGRGQLVLAVDGGWRDAAWRGVIDTLRVGHPLGGTWSLADAAADRQILLGANAVHFPEHCLESAGGRACLGPADGDPRRLSVKGRFDAVPVGVLAAWLPPGLEYEGMVSGHIEVRPGDAGPEGRAQLQLTRGGIRQAAGEGFETLLGWESGVASLDLDGEKARARLDIDLLDDGRVSGHGTVSLAGPGPKPVDATLQASIGNLQLVPSLVPALSQLQGRVTAKLDIGGTLAEPRIRGAARLLDGRARVLALGTDWENIELALNADGRAITGAGHIESGDGHIDIELEGQDSGDGFVGTARVTGENFQAIATPEADVDIAPELNLALRHRDLYIDGEVFVPNARIEPRDLDTATQVSEDQVIVNEQQPSAAGDVRVHAAVTVRLGEDVHLQGFGLAARLQGRVTVSQEPGSPPIGNGRLIVAEGEYTAYGQDLTLAKGELIYTGQRITNPGLDIRAERHPNPDTLVGVSVRGPLANPTTSIYSEPLMSQTAALGLLLFGRTIDEATGTEAQQVNEASIALGLGGGRLLENVGERLGVEEVTVEDIGNRDRASLVLGKYLSPDLYVSYGIGLYDAVNSFRVRYRISRRWMLEATSGLKSSADFIYTIER